MCGYIACAILVPYQGLNPSPLQWKLRILTTGLPVKSFVSYYSPHWSLELTVLWSWVALSASTYLSPLSKVYKCSHLHRWISVSRAHNMGTYTHSHGYSCHLCLNMCWFMYENTQTDAYFYCASQIMLLLFLFFNKLNIYNNSFLNKYIGTIFPTIFANFMPLSPFGNSHNISSHFIIIKLVFLICHQCFLVLLPNKGLDGG